MTVLPLQVCYQRLLPEEKAHGAVDLLHLTTFSQFRELDRPILNTRMDMPQVRGEPVERAGRESR